MKTKKTTIFYATSNPGKFDEVSRLIQRICPSIDLQMFAHEIPEIQSLNQQEIALDKAQRAWHIIKQPLLVDDSGIYFSKYHEFPGTISKQVMQGIGWHGILRLLDHGDEAVFKLTMVYMENPATFELFGGTCEGTIIHPSSFEAPPTLPYDAIFVPRGETRTYNQLRHTPDEEKYSYRMIATKKFATWFSQHRGQK